MKPNIFEQLAEVNVPYAVGMSVNTFKGNWEGTEREYFIIVCVKDKYMLSKLGFNAMGYENTGLMIRELKEKEVIRFKEIIAQFTKVKHTGDGRVYEWKGNKGFKAYFKAWLFNKEVEEWETITRV